MAVPTDLNDLAASLTLEEIPAKLRCGVCNRLAGNAFRIPCCETSVCETCQPNLPLACPVCLHEPVKAEDCTPHKALRTTVKVFLRKKGMERDAARKKELGNTALMTPVTSTALDIPEHAQSSVPASQSFNGPEATTGASSYSREVSQKPQPSPPSDLLPDGHTLSTEAQMDIPRQSIETSHGETIDRTSLDPNAKGNGTQESTQNVQGVGDEQHSGHAFDPTNQWTANTGLGASMMNGGFGFDPSNMGFPNVNVNGVGEFSQMMQFMPNGMANPAMAAFPNMMGMPGMAMDPLTLSQGMYGGFGGQGMGMNAMNGMNMGMGFSAGQGSYGNYNGQPGAWNTAQDKYNPNAYAGHTNGMENDYGASAGYGGYNMPSHQGSFNHNHHHQFSNNDNQNGYSGQGFHNRGRGRGRGYYNAGRGRSGYNQVTSNTSQANYEPFHHQIPPQIAQQGSVQQQEMQPHDEKQSPLADKSTAGSHEGVTVRRLENNYPADEQATRAPFPEREGHSKEDEDMTGKEFAPSDEVNATEIASVVQDAHEDNPRLGTAPENIEKPKLAAIETFVSPEQLDPPNAAGEDVTSQSTAMPPPPTPVIPIGPAAHYSMEHSSELNVRGRGVGRGSFRGGRGRGYGYLPNGSATYSSASQPAPSSVSPHVPPIEPKGLGVEGAPKAPKALREGLPNSGIRGGRGFSIVGRASAAAQTRVNGRERSRSPEHRDPRSSSRSPSPHRSRHQSHRHRSRSESGDSERRRRKERHHRRSRKYEDEEDAGIQGSNERRTRDASPDSGSRKSLHRTHRDHEKEKERDGGRSSHRSHRSHRDRSKDRDEGRQRAENGPRSGGKDVSVVKTASGVVPTSPGSSRRKEGADDSARKRRDREDEEHRDRKRSRRGRSVPPSDKDEYGRDPRRSTLDDQANSRSSNHGSSQPKENVVEKPQAALVKPRIDPHTLEREARDRERLMKEMQRRQAMEGKGTGPKRRDSKVEGRVSGGRRVSYKYEDEESDEARAMRVESEREAGRWR